MDSHEEKSKSENLKNRDAPTPLPSHGSDIQKYSGVSTVPGGGDFLRRDSGYCGDDRHRRNVERENGSSCDRCVTVGFITLVVLMGAIYGTRYISFGGDGDRSGGGDALECTSPDCQTPGEELIRHGLALFTVRAVLADLVFYIKCCNKASSAIVESHADPVNSISRALSAAECLTPLMDQTGMPDLALESLGGLILSIRDTEVIPSKVRTTFLGIPITATSPPPPETIIRIRYPLSPGDCWAFQGDKGNVILQLSKPAVITGLHLEHIHRTMDPYGRLGSAPKDFQIWGLGNYRCLKVSTPRVLLGTFTFHPTIAPLQHFNLQASNQNETFSQIELEVLSNHGDDFTCIYRLRVHGIINTDACSVGEKSE